jgi:sorting nexin-8
VEYVLIANVNDSEETAKELGLLLQNRSVLLNVIPYNPTAVPFDYKAPSQEKTRAFVNMVKEFGVRTLQRQELGQDIASACGQLVVEDAACPSSAPNGLEDLEDLMAGPKRQTLKKEISKRKGGSARAIAPTTKTVSSPFWQNALLNTILVLLAFFLYRWGTKIWALEEVL